MEYLVRLRKKIGEGELLKILQETARDLGLFPITHDEYKTEFELPPTRKIRTYDGYDYVDRKQSFEGTEISLRRIFLPFGKIFIPPVFEDAFYITPGVFSSRKKLLSYLNNVSQRLRELPDTE